ncbi:MAG TPA: heterodisulfide reductase-related iron-sulfur binding cluster [Desulfobacteria bacterium]|nr:heterodisulfide reductase-related iron-sulfur binding cluster [Desulfobacteria bacterium]
MPTRELFWNISDGHLLVYPPFIICLAILIYGLRQRYVLWRVGQPDQRWDNPGKRIAATLGELLSHSRILRDGFPGFMHLFIFWGFLVLTIGTAIVAVQADFGIEILKGNFYLVFSLAMDLAGLVAIIGVLMAAYRRYVVKPDRLDNKSDDGISLLLIFVILVTGFIIEGIRIAATQDSWAIWSPIGYAFSQLFSGISEEGAAGTVTFLWWAHLVLAFGFIAYIPYSKLFHIVSGTVNHLTSDPEAATVLSMVDLEDEEAESYGVSKLEELTWRQLLDSDACTRCGRCQDNCPAYLSKKPLSPKKFTQDIKDHLNQVGTGLAARLKFNSGISQEVAAANEGAEAASPSLIGEVIEEEAIWSCTTCRSCMEQCPVKVENVPKIVDMRRNLVLVESSFPQEAQLTFRNMENNSNPWGVGWNKRADWTEGLDVKTIDEDQNVEYLYWVGCAGSFDDRNKKVARALVQILQKAGVSFAILGTEEKCCGDSARRLGNEYLYQSLAMENVETMNGYGVKKIITHCPHCYNTLKNEYSQMGGNYQVIHHTELIEQLLKEKKLELTNEGTMDLTYHDSCYLGRYNNVYQAPRNILKAIPGASLKEMQRNNEKSFCCGAGGGRMWIDENIGDRINILRTQQALETNASVIATNCPFCLTMLEDGVKAGDEVERVKVQDLAELVLTVMKQ